MRGKVIHGYLSDKLLGAVNTGSPISEKEYDTLDEAREAFYALFGTLNHGEGAALLMEKDDGWKPISTTTRT